MFDSTLLESSPLRSSVLKPAHRLVALVAGGLGSLVTWLLLPILVPYATHGSLLTVAATAGVACSLYALMALYVAADARQLCAGAWWIWTGATLVFSLAGFLVYLFYSTVRTRNWKRISLPLAYVVEVALIGTLVMLPLIHTQALPRLTWTRILPPPGAPRGHAAARSHPPSGAAARTRAQNVVVIPRYIPLHIPEVGDAAETRELIAIDTFGDVPNGVADGVPFSFGPPSSATPPPSTHTAASTKHNPERYRIGGNVQEAKLVYRPTPAYPPLAKMTHIQGTVHLEAVIGTDGTIQGLRVLSGHPLLVGADP